MSFPAHNTTPFLLFGSLIFVFSLPFAVQGAVTYTLGQAVNPTADQQDAYARIKIAMDSATFFYSTYTTINKKLYISYNPSIATADGNINGSIRFGKNRGYMVCGTAMHEIAHTVGVGTCAAWTKLIVNGRYVGANANRAFHAIVHDTGSALRGDSQHFWPYGINYIGEVKSTADLINHCKIVDAMQRDFYPTSLCARGSGTGRGGYFIDVKEPGPIPELALYSPSGRKIAVFAQGIRTARDLRFNPAAINLPAGMYVCRLTAGEFRESRTLVLPAAGSR